MKRKFLSLILAICMVISTITPLMAGEITILPPRMGEENTDIKKDKGDIMVLDPILSEPKTPKVIDDKKPKEEPKLDLSEENEPLVLGAGNSGDFKTEKRADGLYITGLSDTFEELNIAIPKEIDGEPVVGISDGAFLSKKLNITFEANPNLKYIGNHAFFENNVGPLDFKDTTDLVIGNYAFSKNKIMNVRFGENTEIGEYAFRDNGLINLDLSGVSKLGLGSFSNNRIMNLTNINVDLPKYSFINNNLSKIETEHLVDALALTHNHRYVRVLTGNEQNETSKVPNGFGHVVNPVLVRVKFINKERMEEIMPMKIMGDDMSREGEVFILNKENTLKLPQLDGYVPLEKSVTFTPDKDNYDLVLYYKPTDGKPEIVYTVPDKPTWPGDVIDEAYLLSLVKATDMLGNDITDKIEVEPKVLDTNPGGKKPISYTVTDEFGNTQVLNVNIPVGLGWMPVRFDGDWTYGDFTYDGDAVTGLTPEGEKKLDGTRELVIPPKVPDNSVREYEKLLDVKRIGNAAFKEKEINNWLRMPDTIEEIGDEAFYEANISISNEATNNIEKNMEREVIELESKYSQGSKEYCMENVNIYKNIAKAYPSFYLPKNLKKIGTSAFYCGFKDEAFLKVVFIDIIIPDTVEEIGDEAFENNSNNISINIPSSLKELGVSAFQLCSLRGDTLKVPKGLKVLNAQGMFLNYSDGLNAGFILESYSVYNSENPNDAIETPAKHFTIDFSEAVNLEELGTSFKHPIISSGRAERSLFCPGGLYYQYHLTYLNTLDLSPLKNLRKINELFFYGLYIDGDVIIKDLPKLEEIGKASFSNSFIDLNQYYNDYKSHKDSQDKSWMYQSTMYWAFISSDFQIDKKKKVEISNCPKLEFPKSYDSYVFQNQFFSDIILKDLPSVTNLDLVFQGSFPENIVIENLPGVTSLGNFYWEGIYDSRLHGSLDLRGLTNLEKIGGYAIMAGNELENIYIPKTVKYIDNYAIGNILRYAGKDNGVPYKVYIDGGLNPYNLKNGSDYIINPGPFRADFITTDSNGNEVQLKETLKIENYSSGTRYTPPLIEGYKLTEYFDGKKKEKMPQDGSVIIDLNKGGSYKFYYQKLSYKPATYLKYEGVIEGDKVYAADDVLKYRVKVNVIDAHTESLEDATVVINFPPYVDMNSIEMPKSNAITRFNITDNSIEFKIRNLGKGESLDAPILFKFKEYVTPKNTDINTSSYLVLENGVDVIAKSAESVVRYNYKDPSMHADVYYPTDGLGQVQDINGVKRLTSGKDVRISFNLSNGSRYIGDYEIKAKIPTYERVLDTGEVVTEKAGFNKEKSVGWVEDGDYLVYKGTADDKTLSPGASIYYDFINIKEGTKPSIYYEGTYSPYNKPETEPVFKFIGTGDFTAKGPTKLDPSSPAITADTIATLTIGTNSYYNYNIIGGNYIFNNKEWNSKDLEYDIVYSSIIDEPVTNKSFNISNFDSRYHYHTLKLPENGNIETIIKLKDGTEIKSIEKEIALPQNIENISFNFKEPLKPRESFAFKLKGKPIKTLQNDDINLNVSTVSKATRGEKIYTTDATGNSIIKVLPFHHELAPTIEYKVKDSNGNYTIKDKSFVAGKEVEYKISLEDVYKSKKRGTNGLMIEDLKDFKALVKLPKNFYLDKVVLNEDFQKLDEANYKIINHNGEYWLLFSTKFLKKNTYGIASIYGSTTSEMGEQVIDTPVYMNWDIENTEVFDKQADIDADTKAVIGENPGYHKTAYSLAVVKGLSYTLMIKNNEGLYRKELDISKDILDYEMTLSNINDFPVKNVVMYGFVPTNDKGIKAYISEPITVPAGYTVNYTTDENPTEKSEYTNTFSEKVTAFKIVNPNGLKANDVFAIDYKVKLDIPTDLKEKIDLIGLEFKTNALRGDEISGDTRLKSNTAVARYTLPNGTVRFIKYGLKKSIFSNKYDKIPLEGAVFEMRDKSGKFIGKATSGKDGLVEFKDVPAKEYIIKEITAPDGYVKGADISVTLEDYKETDDGIVADLTDGVTNENRILGNLTIEKRVYKSDYKGKLIPGKFRVKGISKENEDIVKEVDVSSGTGTLLNLPEGEYEVEEIDVANKSGSYFRLTNSQKFKIEQTSGNVIVNKNVEVKLLFEARTAYIPLYFVEYPNDKEYPKDITTINNLNEYPVLTNVYDRYCTPDANGKGLIEFDLSRMEKSLDNFKDMGAENYDNISQYIAPYNRSTSPLGSKLNLKIDDDLNVYYTKDGEDKKFDFKRVIIPVQKKKIQNKLYLSVSGQDKDNMPKIYMTSGDKKEELVFDTSGRDQKIDKDLEVGTYSFETVIPNGYFSLHPIKGTIGVNNIYPKSKMNNRYSGDVVKLIKIDDDGDIITKTYSAQMDLNPIEIGLKVVNEENEPIKDAKYELCDTEGKCVALPPAGEDGVIDMSEAAKEMDANKYYSLKNTFTPGEYQKERTEYTFKFMELLVANNLEVPTITRTLYPFKGTIIVSKYGDKKNEVIPGQVFGLYKGGKKIMEGTTDDAGLISFKDLDLGDYVVKEEKVTDEFVLNQKEYNITLTTDQTEVKLEIFNHRWQVVVPKTGTLGIVPYVLIGIMLIGCAYLLLARRKKEDKEK